MEESKVPADGTVERATFVADEAPLAVRCMGSLNNWHDCIEKQAGWLVFCAAMLVGASIPFHLYFETQKAWPFWGTMSLLLLATIVLFTRPFDDRKNIHAIFRFAWGFVAATVVAGGMLLYTTMLPSSKSADSKQAKDALQNTAKKEDELALDQRERRWTLITIVHGCDFHSPKSRPNNPKDDPDTPDDERIVRPQNELPYNPAMPEGVYCGELPPQWVISIGGSIMKCHFDGTCPQTKPPVFDAAKLQIGLQADRAALDRLRASQAGMATRIRETQRAENRGWKISGSGSRDLESQQGTARAAIADLEQKVADAETQLESLKGWKSQAWNLTGAPIVGGIVVPVYFVLMTLIGAIIGLFRKLPEFQDRVEPGYPEEYKKRLADGDSPLPPVSPERARELVVFQILQVVFAPAIGILAYSYARPEEIAPTVVLAFGAGFSSELILVAVRATVDRLIGLGPRPARARAAADEPEKRSELPPPGPVKPTPPSEAGGFKVGDRVTLVKPIGVLLAGSQAIVMSIGDGGVLNARSTQDNTGMPVEIMLEPRPPDFFRHSSQDENAPNGPVG